jgi:hypothetical protein
VTTEPQFPAIARARYWFVFGLFLLLMILVHGGAALAAMVLKPSHSLDYYRTIFAMWATVVLLVPALCFHIFSRSDTPNTYWRAFWTFTYLAFLVHVYWAVFGIFGGDFAATFHSQRSANAEALVEHPYPDYALTVWWGIDVLLAWTVSDNLKAVRVQRGALHLVVFIMFFAATVIAAKAGPVAHVLGIVMAMVVLSFLVLRGIVQETDPKSFTAVVYTATFRFVNLFVPWHRLPTFFGVLNLGALRDVLRANNLYDTSGIAVTEPSGLRPTVPYDQKFLCEREEDGEYNDLSKPTMGNASLNPNDALNNTEFTLSNPGARFGRNIPLSAIEPERDGALLDPSPRLISNRLLGRALRSDGSDDFKPASILNLLAAAWIQFQTHDWFNHGSPRPIDDDPFDIPLPEGDSWPGGKMLVRRTRADPTRRKNDGAGPETFANAETHWWDSSQIYGDSPVTTAKYRTGLNGKMQIDPKTKLIPIEPTGLEATGLTANWWLGLSLLHNLFTLEHNAICDHLVQAFPEWKDDPGQDQQIFRVARLVNSALMAKIHTVDWTTAILIHPALQVGMNANWSGLAGARLKKALGRISESEAISGIPGSKTNQTGADYALTEEFVSVYRLHPLLPNDIQILSSKTGEPGRVLKFEADRTDDPDLIIGPSAMPNARRDGSELVDLIYTFGVHSPGAVTLRNFPNWMRRLRRRNGTNLEELIDLATIDIVRDRERGVPRYNRFRELFHMPRITSFDKMTSDPELARTLKEIYGHPDKVDLMVGMYAETPPEGFGFSDTAFRVFILMASRRLKSDRFFTDDFTAAVYTQPGLDWIDGNNMTSVLMRHFPELTPVLKQTTNAFAPWPPIKRS